MKLIVELAQLLFNLVLHEGWGYDSLTATGYNGSLGEHLCLNVKGKYSNSDLMWDH